MKACESPAPLEALGEMDTKLPWACLDGSKGTYVCPLFRSGIHALIFRKTLSWGPKI